MSPQGEHAPKNPGLRVFFGDLRKMTSGEVADGEVSLIVTSPPYFNAPFDYPDLFPNYDDYLRLIRSFASQSKRVLGAGRICAVVTDDMLVKESNSSRGRKFPLVADTTRIFLEEGLLYRDKITWVKPAGYTRISRRSGVVLQHPYPMYFYPVESSKIDTYRLNDEGWNLTVWNITNVLPMAGRIEEGIAAFPEEIPRRLIKLFTLVGETVLDPFLGSGTTLKVARELGRKGIGYEVDLELKDVIKKKLGLDYDRWTGEEFVIEEREGARRLRKSLQTKVQQQRSVAK